MEETVLLRLYVAGSTSRSRMAIDGIKSAFDDCLKDKGRLEIIDVLKEPGLAEAAKVMATPTLIRLKPSPHRRLIGDLSDGRKAFLLLDMECETL